MKSFVHGRSNFDPKNARHCGFFIFGALLLYLAVERAVEIILAVAINATGIMMTSGIQDIYKAVRPGLFAAAVVPNAFQNLASVLIASSLTLYLSYLYIGFPPKAKVKKMQMSDGISMVIVLCGVSLAGILIGKGVVKLLSLMGLHGAGKAMDVPYGSFPALVLFILTILIISPVFEEFLVRGIMLTLIKTWGGTVAILSTSLLFAVMHSGLAQAVEAFVFSLTVAWFVITFGSLRWAVISHITVNCIAIFEKLLRREIGAIAFSRFQIVFYIVIAILAVLSLWRLQKRHGISKKLKIDIRITKKEFLELFVNPAAIAFYGLILFGLISSVL